MKDERRKRKKEYFIINAARALSSGDFSSDTAGGRLNVKGVNKLGDMKNVCLTSEEKIIYL